LYKPNYKSELEAACAEFWRASLCLRRAWSIRCLWTVLAVLVLVLSIARGSVAFKTVPNIHYQILQDALSPVGFQESAIGEINEGARSQDNPASQKFKEETHHFDGNSIKDSYDYYRDRVKFAVLTAKDCYKSKDDLYKVRYLMGEGYHALQDFYSHSNWLEIQLYDRVKPVPFRWDLYSVFDCKMPDGSFGWNIKPLSNLPERLKTGYFSDAEADAVITEGVLNFSDQNKLAGQNLGAAAAKAQRSLMVEENVKKHPQLRFSSEKEYQERSRDDSSYFYRALAYVVDDSSKSLLHWEVNKDDEHQIEGRMKTPDGQTFHALARQLATEDTQRMWHVQYERLLWSMYEGCANLIIPAVKGKPVPKIGLDLDLSQSQVRTMPVAGTVSVRVENMNSGTARYPLKIKLKLYLERSNESGVIGDGAPLKVLEFRSNAEQSLDLKPFNLVIGNEKGPFSVKAVASFDCDPDFNPVVKRARVGGGKIGLIRASAQPNPCYVEDEVNLLVEYNYSLSSKNPVFGEGYIDKNDGTFKHTFPKQDLPGDGTGWYKPYQEQWVPSEPGEYIWYPRIFTVNKEEVKTSVHIKVLPKPVKGVTATCSVDKPEGQVGETFSLSVPYEITAVPRNTDVPAQEYSRIQQTDGIASGLPESTPTLRSNGDPVKHTAVFNFTPRNPGVYEWFFKITVPQYGVATGSQKIIVRPAKQLVIDSDSVRPESGPSGADFKLHVTYHIVGMSGAESVEVGRESHISTNTGTAPSQQEKETVTAASSVGTLEQDFRGLAPGDYSWTYTIDAGVFGKVSKTIPFRVEGDKDKPLRSMELLSAAVTPRSSEVGDTFVLQIRYRLDGLGAGENIEVQENNYVNFGGKTKTNQTAIKYARARESLIVSTASFESIQAGRHVWNFTLDAPGFKTLYGSVPFDVTAAREEKQLKARLEYSEIVLAPGETKNCSIYISGYRGDTADQVEVIYPQIKDGFGSLPGQIQVFPGNVKMDPSNMRGLGDFTAEYALGQGYRARETAPPGVTEVRIVVRQEDADEVTLKLLVRVVRKGESSGPLIPGSDPRVSLPGAGPGGNAPGAGTGGNAPGAGPGGNAPGAGPGGNAPGAGPGGNAPGSGSGGNAPGAVSEGTEAKTVTYYFKKVTFLQGPGEQPITNSSASDSIPLAWNESDSALAGTATQDVKAQVNYTFPEKIVLRNINAADPTSYTGNPTISCSATAQFARAGRTSAFSVTPVGIFVGDKAADVNSVRKNAEDHFSSGSKSFSLNWVVEPLVEERATFINGVAAHQPVLEIFNTGDTYVMIGSNDVKFTSRTVFPYRLEYTVDPKAVQANATNVSSAVILSARLEKPRITVEVGSTPGVIANILIDSWNRDTAEMVEVNYPGQGPMSTLQNDIHVFSGSGKQLPSALAAVENKDGTYVWTQSYEALSTAKPGLYQVPIQVQQVKGGFVPLTQEIEIVSNKKTPVTTGGFTALVAGATPVGGTTSLANSALPGRQALPTSDRTAGGAAVTGGPPAVSSTSAVPNHPGGASTTSSSASTQSSSASTQSSSPSTPSNPPTTLTQPKTRPGSIWEQPSTTHTPKPENNLGDASRSTPPVTVLNPPALSSGAGWNQPKTGTGADNSWARPGVDGGSQVHQPQGNSNTSTASADIAGEWYGGSGSYMIVQRGTTVTITVGGEYATTWIGTMTGRTINGNWTCPRISQKGTFTFTYNPNYQTGYMERISGTYYIEDKWGKDPRDFYADRKIVRGR